MTFEELGIRVDGIASDLGLIDEWAKLVNTHGTHEEFAGAKFAPLLDGGRLSEAFRAQLDDLRARKAASEVSSAP